MWHLHRSSIGPELHGKYCYHPIFSDQPCGSAPNRDSFSFQTSSPTGEDSYQPGFNVEPQFFSSKKKKRKGKSNENQQSPLTPLWSFVPEKTTDMMGCGAYLLTNVKTSSKRMFGWILMT